MKKKQSIMIWILPVILIGGVIYPLIGFAVAGMVFFFLILSIFKSRYWCWHLCPRGSFLDIVMSRFSPNRSMPKFMTRDWFRWSVVVFFGVFLTYRLARTGGNLAAIGSVFVGICTITTIIAIVLGVTMKHRGWCMMCPMGNIQEKIGRIRKNR